MAGARPGFRRRLGGRRAVLGVVALLVGGALALGWARFRNRPVDGNSGLDPTHVAVLYFDDLSDGARLGPVASGLTEDLIDRLSQVEALHVITPGGVRPFRGAAVSPDSIARSLQVGTLVAGSVSRSQDQLRVTIRLVDAWLAFPGILIYLMLATLVREWKLAGFWNDLALIFALGTNQVPRLARLVRGTVLAEKEKEYVEACRAVGESSFYIPLREILPNCISPVIVQASLSIAAAILLEAALSFLGVGVKPPTPTWGGMLRHAFETVSQAPWLTVSPGVVIFLVVLACNFFGDALRDVLDPRLKGTR